ncbi:MAG: MFS transporter [Roseovarius sp.]
MARNIRLYRWFRFFQGLVFWQAVWFLYFQTTLSPAEAVLLYAVYDVATTALEVPSGWMSDRLGRRATLIASGLAGVAGAALLATGDSFLLLCLAQVLIGAAMAFSSGTDSAFLYESLAAAGREAEVEQQELTAWRFSFAAHALSAIIGGLLYRLDITAPFWAGTLAGLVVLALALAFREPPRDIDQSAPLSQLATLRDALHNPALAWLFALSVAMYGFSHLPFVFGQPFILDALTKAGLAAEAPVVSGAVTSAMMVISVLASLLAPRLRSYLGLPAILLVAFAMQIALCGVLALSDSIIVIAILFLRMVPDSLSWPFLVARVQTLLTNGGRATYLSLQSFCGRLVFAGTLYLVSRTMAGTEEMNHAGIQTVLGWSVVVGVVILAGLLLAGRRARVESA